MNAFESILQDKRASELFGQPLPEKIRLVGELPDGMVVATAQEVLGTWADQVHAHVLFLKQTSPDAQKKQSDDVYAIVPCTDEKNNNDLVAVVVKTSMYEMSLEIERLRGHCDLIYSEHGKKSLTYDNFIKFNNALMLRTRRWFVNAHDGLSEPLDQIPA